MEKPEHGGPLMMTLIRVGVLEERGEFGVADNEGFWLSVTEFAKKSGVALSLYST